MRLWVHIAAALAVVVSLALTTGAGTEGNPAVARTAVGPVRVGRVAGGTHLPASRAGTFISLWPACGCGRHTALDQFSLRTGQRLGTIARVPVAGGESVSPPAARLGGPVLLTFSSGPKCAGPIGGGASAGPCIPVAGSCQSRVESLGPESGAVRTLLSFPASTLVSDAMPSPAGRMLVMDAAGCATSFMDAHLVVRDLASGRQWSIGADAARCHQIGPVSWSADSSRLVFPYAPAILPSGTKPSTAPECTAPRYDRLAVVASRQASATSSWKLTLAAKGCSFTAAAFDAKGIAATEACRGGSHPGAGADPKLGNVFLLQLNAQDHVIARVALQPGWEQGRVSTIGRTGMVLISQDQPANEGYPERDWVWEFNGHHLRLIAQYAAHDAAQVIAAPW